jgi:hypothetical protein
MGIGATVRVIAGDQQWIRSVEGGSAQGNQNSLKVHVGLGSLETIDAVEVRFIGGGLVRFEGPIEVDQHLKLYESGRVE